jgi:hypothetical protein
MPKCACERLVRAVPGLEGDVEYAEASFEKAKRSPLEEDPAPQPAGWLARRSRHHAIQLRPGQLHLGGELVAPCRRVQARGYGRR